MNQIELPAVTRDVIALNSVADELKRARAKHKDIASPHDAYGIIAEEFAEFFDEVRADTHKKDPARMFKELIQIAATAIRATSDLKLTPEFDP